MRPMSLNDLQNDVDHDHRRAMIGHIVESIPSAAFATAADRRGPIGATIHRLVGAIQASMIVEASPSHP